MRHTLLLTIIAIGVAFAAAGCTSGPGYEETTPEPAYEEPVAPAEPAQPAQEQPEEEAPQESPFQAQYDASVNDPEVTVVNNSEESITVTLSGPAYQCLEVAPWASQTIVVPAGTYSFTGTAPGVQPTSGTNGFETSYRYTWTFAIVDTPQ